MKLKPPVYLIALLLLLLGTAAWADQIVLRDGTVYSGKFIRGDAKLIDWLDEITAGCRRAASGWIKAACPLLRSLSGVKRTWLCALHMSASDP